MRNAPIAGLLRFIQGHVEVSRCGVGERRQLLAQRQTTGLHCAVHFAQRDVGMFEKRHLETGVVTDDARAFELGEHADAGAIEINDQNLPTAVIGLHESYPGSSRIQAGSLGAFDLNAARLPRGDKLGDLVRRGLELAHRLELAGRSLPCLPQSGEPIGLRLVRRSFDVERDPTSGDHRAEQTAGLGRVDAIDDRHALEERTCGRRFGRRSDSGRSGGVEHHAALRFHIFARRPSCSGSQRTVTPGRVTTRNSVLPG